MNVLHPPTCSTSLQTRCNGSDATAPLLRGRARRACLVTQATLQATPSQVEQAQSVNSLVCPHPDAIRRRQEQEEWRQRQAAERRQAEALQSMGLKWFEGPLPDNMFLCKSADDYKRLLSRASSEGKLLVAKFFTEDCYVCKTLHPKIKKMAGDNNDVIWCKLNGSDPELAGLFESLGITKVPLFHMVRDGELVSVLTASLSPDKLARFRAELAAHKPSSRHPTQA